ncbi:MAG: toll/interleukin-1 receptor domain-containing protein [Candidatus Thiosymbion ectosymbiont of Robbea hypermnestra]|nr:toll/interleukin-1 receptor domain-containing protein [Candidatus Thiosymbion ectosymbiont of Robbea hypermnestra]
MTEKKRYDVFLSHAKEDKEWVREFAATLEDAGIHVWFDEEIEAGQEWERAIEEALRDSSTLVLILTPNNLNSHWMFFEVGAAIADHKKIIPVLAQDIEMSQLPTFMSSYQIIKELSPAEAGARVTEAMEYAAA